RDFLLNRSPKAGGGREATVLEGHFPSEIIVAMLVRKVASGELQQVAHFRDFEPIEDRGGKLGGRQTLTKRAEHRLQLLFRKPIQQLQGIQDRVHSAEAVKLSLLVGLCRKVTLLSGADGPKRHTDSSKNELLLSQLCTLYVRNATLC